MSKPEESFDGVPVHFNIRRLTINGTLIVQMYVLCILYVRVLVRTHIEQLS